MPLAFLIRWFVFDLIDIAEIRGVISEYFSFLLIFFCPDLNVCGNIQLPVWSE